MRADRKSPDLQKKITRRGRGRGGRPLLRAWGMPPPGEEDEKLYRHQSRLTSMGCCRAVEPVPYECRHCGAALNVAARAWT
jgi:hypothetical protein